jgi:hypothetical protein
MVLGGSSLSSGKGVMFDPPQVLDSHVCPTVGAYRLQGYLAHKKVPPLMTLRKDYAWGPVMVLGRWCLLMSEVPLYAM